MFALKEWRFMLKRFFPFATKKIAYDFGAHNGDNIPYYLLKYEKVVAVEANPIMIETIRKRFKLEIAQGRLSLENCVVSNQKGLVDFYLHRFNSVLSQLPKPQNLEDFNHIQIHSKKPSQIIKKYGRPEYIKIDVEHVDFEVLSELFGNDIYPRYISAEVHDVRVFSLLTSSKFYNEFKLLEGNSVQDLLFVVDGEVLPYRFPHHSAGPMFEDIHTESLTAAELFEELAVSGFGWRDIHAKKSC